MNAMFKLKMNQGLLDCSYCHLPLRPCAGLAGAAFTCFAGHIYCGRSRCIQVHIEACRGGCIYCKLLEDTVTQMKVKCECDEYIPYFKFLDHQHECPWFLIHQRESSTKSSAPPPMRKCMLKKSRLLCEQCKAPLRPPLFKHCSRDLLVCSGCYGGNIATYRHCTQLEYLVQGMTVKCVACKQYLPFSTLALHQVEDCPFKHKWQEIAPGSSARKICGKNKRKASIEVGEVEVGNEDDSCDDNRDMSEDEFSCEDDSIDEIDEEETPKKPETGKRVAQNAFKTPACDKKAKIATPPRQKTGDKMSGLVTTALPAKLASNRPNVNLPKSSGGSNAASSTTLPTKNRPKM